MSKKINLGTINTTSIAKFSNYNVALFELRALSETFKSEKKKIEAKIVAKEEERKTAVEAGMTQEEAISNFSVEPFYKELRALEVKYKTDCEPHKDAKSKALELIPQNLYYGYVLTQDKGLDAKSGNVTIGKTTIVVNQSLKSMVKNFLTTIGCDASNDTALTKFATKVITWSSGMKACNKGEDYLALKSETQYKDIVMRAFLQYLVREVGVVTKNDDNTLSMTVYED